LRLLLLLVIFPGLINGFVYLARPLGPDGLWYLVIAGILDTYLAMVFLAILAFAYRHLSDQPLPEPEQGEPGAVRPAVSRLLKPVGLILLLAFGGAAVWDAFYQVESDQNVFVTRFGKPERFESDPGVRFKVPFVEDTQVVAKKAGYSIAGEGVFLTMSKQRLPLKYEFQWQISNEEIFARSIAGRVRQANRHVDQVAHDTLRDVVARLNSNQVGFLRDAGKVSFGPEETTLGSAALGGVLAKINSRVEELGVRVSSWKVETAASVN
jgi:hypothetical protein